MKYLFRAMRLAALFLFTAAISGCSDSNTDDPQTPPPPAGGKEKIYAEILCPDSDSGADCMDSYWKTKATIDVFTEDARSKYTFLGKTGDYSGEFAKAQDYDKVNCEYNGAYAMSNCKGYSTYNNALRLQYTVSSALEYTKNTFNTSFNVLYGTSEDGEEFEFSSLLGVLQVNLIGTDILKSITLTGNNKENISGTCYLDVNSPEKVTFKSKASEVALHCSKGEQLSADTPTQFNFLILPTTFSKGITLTITYMDDTTYEIVHSEPCTVKRNHVCKIPTLSSIDPDLQLASVTFTGKSLLLPTFSTEETPIYGTASMGDGGKSISLETFTSYDYAKEAEYTATFKVKKAASIKFETLEGISKINLSNF